MANRAPRTHAGYGSGHPWYYVLGGPVLFPKQIRAAAIIAGYRGYMPDELDRLDKLPEPRRSEALRMLRDEVTATLAADLSAYRHLARQLREHRKGIVPADELRCADIHMAVSLKHNHLYNDFAILTELDRLLSVQPDLFGG